MTINLSILFTCAYIPHMLKYFNNFGKHALYILSLIDIIR